MEVLGSWIHLLLLEMGGGRGRAKREGSYMVLVLKEIWSQLPDSIIPFKLLLSLLSCTP